jgi:small subunit ribosomal protein S15
MTIKEKKTETIAEFRTHETDTGSTEVQVALLTRRIEHLVGHLKKNVKDNHSRRGLLLLVGQRKRLLNYLKREDAKRFDVLTGSLKLQ